MCWLSQERFENSVSWLPSYPSSSSHICPSSKIALSISLFTYLSIYTTLKRNQNSFCISITLYIVNLLWFLALQIYRGVAVNDLSRHPAGVCAARVAKVRGKDGKSARGSDQFCFLSEPASLCWRCNAVSAPHTTHLTSGAGGGWGMSVLGRSPSSVSSCCVSVKPSWPKTSVEHSPYKRWSNEPSFGKGWALQVKHLHAGKR